MRDGQSSQLFGVASSGQGNNYSRPEGQNVGNFLGVRPSSRVLAAPGGASSFSFGGDAPATSTPATPDVPEPEVPKPSPIEVPAPNSAKDDKASFLSAMTAKIAGHAGVSSATGASAKQGFASPTRNSAQVRCSLLPQCPGTDCA
jgi:hypothetical protein